MDPQKHLKFKIQIHVDQAEYDLIKQQFSESGRRSMSYYLRTRLLKEGKQLLAVNPIEFLRHLDKIGTEIGRIGNNMNQLARYVHILAHEGQLNEGPVKEFNHLMDEYMKTRRELVKAYRAVVRLR